MRKKKVVYAVGVFDLFHRGHLSFLKKAKKLGDKLIVAVNGDELVGKYKRKPFFNEKDRLEIIKALKIVDKAFIIKEFDNKPYLKKYKVDIIVHGDDWDEESYMEQIRVDKKFLKENRIELVFVPYTKGISTSELIRRIRECKD